jgi:hypothetical protein
LLLSERERERPNRTTKYERSLHFKAQIILMMSCFYVLSFP